MFKDRDDAARQLAGELEAYSGGETVVVGLARGGVVLAYRLARLLDAALDVMVVRKVGAPWNPELAIGAITDGVDPQVFLNERLIDQLSIEKDVLDSIVADETATLQRRKALYEEHLERQDLRGRTVIVTDDGIATGATVQVAIKAIQRFQPGYCILAVPVGSPDSLRRLQPEVDRLVCLQQPAFFQAVGQFYQDFRQVDDSQVIGMLERYKSTIEG